MTSASPSGHVVGFGALNLDYIGGASKLSTRISDLVKESTARFERGIESAASGTTISEAIEHLGAASLDATLGGSAFNTISALAHMRLGLKLGYVGFLGRVPVPGLSFAHEMDMLGIDHTFVGKDETRSCGVCLSYIEDGERMLLTEPGANVLLHDYLDKHMDELAVYLASADAIHVTSFLDSYTPVKALELLQHVKGLSPHTLISLDPGHTWALERIPAVQGLLLLADYLLLTYREFKALGGYAHGESDEAVAAKVLHRCKEQCIVLVTKSYDSVDAFQRLAGPAVGHQHFSREWLAKDEVTIEDATGAGDIFAAGLLAALTAKGLHVELGAFLGMSLVRHRLQDFPLEGHPALPNLAKGFLQAEERANRRVVLPRGVFIAHGADPQWQQVKEFMQVECRLPVHVVDPDVDGEADAAATLTNVLRSCSFAVCVLTAEDMTSQGINWADQAVIHQVGVFQGRYGFERVAILVQEGCQVFSNVTGLVRLEFRAGRIEKVFWQLHRLLRREGLI